ncbi:hypothetical protein pb186bvf_012025 [Paramecium bursaria]
MVLVIFQLRNSSLFLFDRDDQRYNKSAVIPYADQFNIYFYLIKFSFRKKEQFHYTHNSFDIKMTFATKVIRNQNLNTNSGIDNEYICINYEQYNHMKSFCLCEILGFKFNINNMNMSNASKQKTLWKIVMLQEFCSFEAPQQGVQSLKEMPKLISASKGETDSNKDTQSSKSPKIEKKYFVEVSLKKISFANISETQSLSVLPKSIERSYSKKRTSLKQDIKLIKIQNEQNIQEFNSKIQSMNESQKLQQLNQIIELQTFGQKILNQYLKTQKVEQRVNKMPLNKILPILIDLIICFFNLYFNYSIKGKTL